MLRGVAVPRTNKHKVYTGVTDAAGLWAVMFDPTYPAAPHINVELIGADENTQYRFLVATPSGFTVHVFRRTVINVLGLQVPSFTVENVAGQACSAVATEVI